MHAKSNIVRRKFTGAKQQMRNIDDDRRGYGNCEHVVNANDSIAVGIPVGEVIISHFSRSMIV